jgi:Zn-dependent protease with chaperone function
MTHFARLRVAKDYIFGTFKIRRVLLITVVGLSLLFTTPVLGHLATWARVDLVYLYAAVIYVTGLFMYGAFRRPLKSLAGSIFLSRRYKAVEFTSEKYEAFGVPQIMSEMGIAKRVRVYVTDNPWIGGPFTNALTNNVFLPTSWMNRFPRLEIRGVLGHELGHVKTKGKYLREAVMGMGAVIGVALFFETHSIPIVSEIFELALAFLMLTVLSWRSERRADLEGAKVTGPEPLISVFEQLKAEGGRDDGSETHPSLSDRITRLSLLLRESY